MAWWNRLSKRGQMVATVVGWILAISGALIAFGATQAKGELNKRVTVVEERLEDHDSVLLRFNAMADTVSLTWCVVKNGALGEDVQRKCLFGEGGG